MKLNEKCCDALGCRSEIEKELESLRKVVRAMSRDVQPSFCVNLMSNFFRVEPIESTVVNIGDYYYDGDAIQYIENQFAADCINGYLLGAGDSVKVWRNENA